jgi:CBS domain-containing protein
MQVRDAMSELVLNVGPGHTLRQAAKRMTDRNVGSAVVIDPELPGPGIITERDLLRSVALGQDLDRELVGDHMSSEAVSALPDWSLERAAEAMARRGFRHLVVVEGSDVIGVVSLRDIVRVWAASRDGLAELAR